MKSYKKISFAFALLATTAKSTPAQADPAPEQPTDTTPPTVIPITIDKRLERLCGISLACSQNKESGMMLLPSASLGLVQIPFSNKGEGPSYRDGFGDFKPTIGATLRYWLNSDWWDVHAQFLYGLAPSSPTNEDHYVWGVTAGVGAIFSIFNLDIGFFDRRVKKTSSEIDNGFAALINVDLTAVGILLGTATSR
jgi:hypothetical protein